MTSNRSDRRRFLGFCTNLLLAAIGLIVAIPAVAYFWAPLRRRQGGGGAAATFVDVGLLSDLPLGEWNLRALELTQEDGWKKTRIRHSVYVRRRTEGDQNIDVLAPICPHLGCPINWHREQTQFVCPCHRGVFDADGRRISGPPPRSMDALEFEVRAGRLWVRWQDFKIGVAERVPLTA